jgi:hypothetical protein
VLGDERPFVLNRQFGQSLVDFAPDDDHGLVVFAQVKADELAAQARGQGVFIQLGKEPVFKSTNIINTFKN